MKPAWNSSTIEAEPLRVLMTADTLGGVWTYAVELIKALQPEVSVVLAALGAPLNSAQWADIERLGIDVHESNFKLEWMDDPWEDVAQSGEWLQEIARLVQPELIHFNSFPHASLAWQCPTLLAAHSCVYSWWRAVHRCEPPAEWARYYTTVRHAIHAADYLVTPSRALLRELQEIYGNLRQASVIYNGRNLDDFSARQKEKVIFCAARLWDEAKNTQALCTAAKKVDWPIYVGGDTHSPDGQLSSCAGVRALGRLSPNAVSHWMSRAGIYALPARYEPFGLSILEAALSGCALVLGDIPSLREIWGDAAVYVEPENPADLRRALNALIEDETLLKHFGGAAQRRAESYSPGAMGLHYLSLYRQMLRARAAA